MSLKVCFFLFCFYFSSTGHFVQPSRTISAVLVNGHMRNISMMLSGLLVAHFENIGFYIGSSY